MLRALLQQVGVNPVIVENGRLAVEAWKQEPWDLVLMDMHLPEMDGATAVQIIRSAERLLGRARTPIVAVTASAMSDQLADYTRCGVDDVVAKPLDADALFSTLERVLRPPVEAAAVAA